MTDVPEETALPTSEADFGEPPPAAPVAEESEPAHAAPAEHAAAHASAPAHAAPRATFHAHAKAKKVAPALLASARVHHRWAVGQTMSEAEFDAQIKATSSLKFG